MMRFRKTDGGGAEMKKRAGLLLVCALLAALLLSGCSGQKQAEYRAALAKNGDEYPVLSVDPQWGFVVIGAGQGSNIDPNTVLLVTRDGRSIGKLKVTSLEKNQTVADIVKDSVPAGMSIQPGDMVQLLRPLQSAK